MPVMLTKEIILQEVATLIDNLLVWEIEGAEMTTKALFYIDGAHDLAKALIERMEGKGV